MLEARKMGKRKNLSCIDKNQIVMTIQVGQSNSKMSRLLWGVPGMQWLVVSTKSGPKKEIQ